MKNFWKACKNRPLTLWILLFAWLMICTFLCATVIHMRHTPLALLFYLFALVPALQLIIYTKPLNGYDIVQIICMYFIILNTVCSWIWSEAPVWVFVTLSLVYAWVMVLFIILEIRTNQKKRNG